MTSYRQPVGTGCTSHHECASGFCQYQSCAAPGAGQFCSPLMQNCPNGYSCSVYSWTCTPANYDLRRSPLAGNRCYEQSDCRMDEFCNTYRVGEAQQPGTCAPRRRIRSLCLRDLECQHGLACGLGTCRRLCIPSSAMHGCQEGESCLPLGPHLICLPIRRGSAAEANRLHQTVFEVIPKWFIVGVFGIFMSVILAACLVLKWRSHRQGRAGPSLYSQKAFNAPALTVLTPPPFGNNLPPATNNALPPPYSAESGPVLAWIDPNGPGVSLPPAYHYAHNAPPPAATAATATTTAATQACLPITHPNNSDSSNK